MGRVCASQDVEEGTTRVTGNEHTRALQLLPRKILSRKEPESKNQGDGKPWRAAFPLPFYAGDCYCRRYRGQPDQVPAGYLEGATAQHQQQCVYPENRRQLQGLPIADIGAGLPIGVAAAAPDDVRAAQRSKEDEHSNKDEEDEQAIAAQILIVVWIGFAGVPVAVAASVMWGAGPAVVDTAGSFNLVRTQKRHGD